MKSRILIAFVIGIISGFVLKKQDYKVVTKAVKGDIVKEVVYVPSPSIEHSKLDISSLPHYVFKEIIKVDTITNVLKVDTLAILRDYVAIKDYSYTLFNNEYGKLILDQQTQYNSIVSTSYNYEPLKQIESYQKRWQLLIGASYSSNDYIGPSVGFIYKNLGIVSGYKYNFSDKKNIVDITMLYRL